MVQGLRIARLKPCATKCKQFYALDNIYRMDMNDIAAFAGIRMRIVFFTFPCSRPIPMVIE
jgi:hypothetical protein